MTVPLQKAERSKTSPLLPAWTRMFRQSVHSGIDTAQPCAGNDIAGQRGNLPL